MNKTEKRNELSFLFSVLYNNNFIDWIVQPKRPMCSESKIYKVYSSF